MLAFYLSVSAEARLQDVGEFGVPERNMKSITLQRTEHLKGGKNTDPLIGRNFYFLTRWWGLYFKHSSKLRLLDADQAGP